MQDGRAVLKASQSSGAEELSRTGRENHYLTTIFSRKPTRHTYRQKIEAAAQMYQRLTYCPQVGELRTYLTHSVH
jgi:hypothetical protein